jgi:pimeloyl-ACP methyl ester carboxylesterase
MALDRPHLVERWRFSTSPRPSKNGKASTRRRRSPPSIGPSWPNPAAAGAADPGGVGSVPALSHAPLGGDPTRIDSDALAEYLRSFRLDSVIRASCADYRAGATTDSEDDAADRAAGKRIACPLLLLWGAGRGDLLPVWRRWADDVRGEAIDSGHFLQEEAPEEVMTRLLPFLEAP